MDLGLGAVAARALAFVGFGCWWSESSESLNVSIVGELGKQVPLEPLSKHYETKFRFWPPLFQVEAVSMETMTHNAVITACELPSCKTYKKWRPRLFVAVWKSSLPCLMFAVLRVLSAELKTQSNADQCVRFVGIISMAGGAGKSTCRKTRSNPQEVELLRRGRDVDSTSDCDSAAKGIKLIESSTLQPPSFVSV